MTPGAAAAQRAGRVALPERDVESGPREELRRGVGGAELAVRGLSLRAACLPLLRHGDGGLEQAVRIVVEAEPGLGRVRLALPGADPVAFEGPGRHRVLLYVPEVREPRAVVLEAEAGGTRHELALELRPQRHWEVFLCHQSHLDIGYTDPQDRVLAHHLQYLDSVLELAESTDDWPEDARFRWNIEATWPLEAWLAARQAELSTLVRFRTGDGKLVEIASVESELPGVAVKASRGAAAVAVVRVTVTEEVAKRSGRCQVRVKLAQPADQEIVIPVVWTRAMK